MSILIKGMEMPKSCSECLEIGWHYVFECRLDDMEDDKRLPDCPLVPVPPHGRLIDGDVAEVIHFTADDAEGRDFYDGILFAADFISKQPTIIPAEEGET